MFSILLETRDVIAVDKPAGLAAIPERDPTRVCLLAQLAEHYGEKLYVVHRLDKEVSGVMVFARNAHAHRYLNDQFCRRAVAKTYTALAHGRLIADQGAIDQPLHQFGSGRVAVDDRRGKPSLTEYRVAERLTGYTLLDVTPLSGRRHQIRAHLYSIGHPLVGDRRYGDPGEQARFPRLMLHARRLAFTLPDGNSLAIAAPLPESFTEVLAGMRAASVASARDERDGDPPTLSMASHRT
ncbi:MAG: RluA family pseudouridine synthase [Gammaproteobacteria bacterium]|nr:RluA family pseudouridine synthase [Gammaproteobacteria bacterium]MCP5424307.1 RluA family pseudouridine synthase [Gammaproteobacteria bacterium]MCP5459060.1 RluA family pseudouridine synthase [Gammaproteobacteria bacterium]